MIGYLEIGDSDNARVVKNRLTHSIEHLRRLSTFTIDAIIWIRSYHRNRRQYALSHSPPT
jgi:hypothetical protein